MYICSHIGKGKRGKKPSTIRKRNTFRIGSRLSATIPQDDDGSASAADDADVSSYASSCASSQGSNDNPDDDFERMSQSGKDVSSIHDDDQVRVAID
jgi:hypothetical protein